MKREEGVERREGSRRSDRRLFRPTWPVYLKIFQLKKMMVVMITALLLKMLEVDVLLVLLVLVYYWALRSLLVLELSSGKDLLSYVIILFVVVSG